MLFWEGTFEMVTKQSGRYLLERWENDKYIDIIWI